jgi:hypothetical protein
MDQDSCTNVYAVHNNKIVEEMLVSGLRILRKKYLKTYHMVGETDKTIFFT